MTPPGSPVRRDAGSTAKPAVLTPISELKDRTRPQDEEDQELLDGKQEDDLGHQEDNEGSNSLPQPPIEYNEIYSRMVLAEAQVETHNTKIKESEMKLDATKAEEGKLEGNEPEFESTVASTISSANDSWQEAINAMRKEHEEKIDKLQQDQVQMQKENTERLCALAKDYNTLADNYS